jgi:hypothetical protein
MGWIGQAKSGGWRGFCGGWGLTGFWGSLDRAVEWELKVLVGTGVVLWQNVGEVGFVWGSSLFLVQLFLDFWL